MSWAAHNPEKYDEILVDGVASRIMRELQLAGFDEADWETVRQVVEILQVEASGPTSQNAWSQLISWAHKDITAAEGDYFASLADAAKERTR